ncbi:MAG: response regulator transcription factor [Xanthomonadales bacterium]|nr:response regulator transcription factor [Xanthomonadales bacterium]
MRILLVEDDQQLSELVATSLHKSGYVVDQVYDGIEGLYYGREFPVDLAIVDLGLPKINGMDLIRKLRDEGFTYPVLILTARNQWQEKVAGLEAGADDYLTKPFNVQELKARVAALLRRSSGHATPKLVFGPLAVDLNSQRVSVDDAEIDLTSYEYKVLEYLLMHPDKIVTKMNLVDHIYAEDSDRDSNVIEVFIGRLRRKLDPDGTLEPIETLRGRGYRFALEKKR